MERSLTEPLHLSCYTMAHALPLLPAPALSSPCPGASPYPWKSRSGSCPQGLCLPGTAHTGEGPEPGRRAGLLRLGWGGQRPLSIASVFLAPAKMEPSSAPSATVRVRHGCPCRSKAKNLLRDGGPCLQPRLSYLLQQMPASGPQGPLPCLRPRTPHSAIP